MWLYLRTESSSTFSMAVQFCHNHRSYVHFVFESFYLKYKALK